MDREAFLALMACALETVKAEQARPAYLIARSPEAAIQFALKWGGDLAVVCEDDATHP